ncbi:MAG: glutamate--tRNA ligase [Actinobacteria bacterium]|nr:glutamate--tRNA ligase [Actinomycetota bacterium]
MSETVRVRFAPSPTGHLHIGGARTAIYNWAFARHHGGSFILRIDDTDKERSTDENTQAILSAMRWLGLDWDEGPDAGGEFGPYSQALRKSIYDQALNELKLAGNTYPCFCDSALLEAKREAARAAKKYSGYDRTCRDIPAHESERRIAAEEPHVWRIKTPLDRGDIVIDDVIRGQVTFPLSAMDDFVLVRTDTSPTYMFATVVDDWHMGITHIIRGDDHLSNTPRQVIVFEALGAKAPVFAHMGLIFGPDGKRLSKRHGATSVESYREMGYLPEALLNYLALLGWSLDEDNIFDRDTLVRRFELSRVSKNPAVWDIGKLEWMNGVYLREMTAEEFISKVLPLLDEAGLIAEDQVSRSSDWLLELAPLVSERIKRLDEVVEMVAFLFTDDLVIDERSFDAVLAKEGASDALEAVASVLNEVEMTPEAVEEAMREVPGKLELKPKLVFQATRVAVTGSTVSPPLFESIVLLGRERALKRVWAAVDSIKKRR